MKFVHQLFVVKSLSPYIISSEAKLQMHGYNVAGTLTGGGFIQLQKKTCRELGKTKKKNGKRFDSTTTTTTTTTTTSFFQLSLSNTASKSTDITESDPPLS